MGRVGGLPLIARSISGCRLSIAFLTLGGLWEVCRIRENLDSISHLIKKCVWLTYVPLDVLNLELCFLSPFLSRTEWNNHRHWWCWIASHGGRRLWSFNYCCQINLDFHNHNRSIVLQSSSSRSKTIFTIGRSASMQMIPTRNCRVTKWSPGTISWLTSTWASSSSSAR